MPLYTRRLDHYTGHSHKILHSIFVLHNCKATYIVRISIPLQQRIMYATVLYHRFQLCTTSKLVRQEQTCPSYLLQCGKDTTQAHFCLLNKVSCLQHPIIPCLKVLQSKLLALKKTWLSKPLLIILISLCVESYRTA